MRPFRALVGPRRLLLASSRFLVVALDEDIGESAFTIPSQSHSHTDGVFTIGGLDHVDTPSG